MWMCVPLSDVPDQAVTITPAALSYASVAMNHPFKKILQTPILNCRLGCFKNFKMPTSNMAKQNASGFRARIALDVALEHLKHR